MPSHAATTDEERRSRLARATNVAGGATDERFERVTRLARAMFGVPVAQVRLVDAAGGAANPAGVDLPADAPAPDDPFSAHALLGPEVFVVEDAARDPRFADDPHVTGTPGVRFYAGCPLRVEPGLTVGTLCLLDTKPRRFSGEEVYQLRDLAGIVEAELAALLLADAEPAESTDPGHDPAARSPARKARPLTEIALA